MNVAGCITTTTRLDDLADRLAPLVADGDSARFSTISTSSSTTRLRGPNGIVMDALSVPETYFWREVDQIQAIVDVVVPELAARYGQLPIRIWCVPCAAGEEPLTIAMALEEVDGSTALSIDLRAADASRAALARARAGVYRDRAFRVLPGSFGSLLHDSADGWHVDPALHARAACGGRSISCRARRRHRSRIATSCFAATSSSISRRGDQARRQYVCRSHANARLFVCRRLGIAFASDRSV